MNDSVKEDRLAVLRREVALKVMKLEVARKPHARERFLREARW